MQTTTEPGHEPGRLPRPAGPAPGHQRAVVGETWFYYLLGSVVEVVLLGCIIWTARKWQPGP